MLAGMASKTRSMEFAPHRPRLVFAACAVLFLAGLALTQVDHPFSRWLHRSLMPWDPWLQRITTVGEGWFLAPACIVAGAGFAIFRNHYWKSCALALASLVVSLAPTHLLKWVLGRPRPYLAGDTRFESIDFTQFQWFAETHDFRGFPSGHSSAVFAVLWIGASLHAPRAVRAAFVITGVVVGMSRVALAKHFLGDVVAGAGIGIAVAQTVVLFYQRRSRRA